MLQFITVHQGTSIYTSLQRLIFYFRMQSVHTKMCTRIQIFNFSSNDAWWIVIDCDPDSGFSIPLKSLHPDASVTILTVYHFTHNSSSRSSCCAVSVSALPLAMVVVSVHYGVDAAVQDSGEVEEVLHPAWDWGCRLLGDGVPVKTNSVFIKWIFKIFLGKRNHKSFKNLFQTERTAPWDESFLFFTLLLSSTIKLQVMLLWSEIEEEF